MCQISADLRGRSPGIFCPQLGPHAQLFVITGGAVTSRSSSSLVSMRRWSAKRNESIKGELQFWWVSKKSIALLVGELQFWWVSAQR